MRRARVGLTILATSDLHAAMLAYDYFADRPGRGGSLARLATMIGAARQDAGACLLLDNGDFLLGTPLADAHLPAGAGRKNPVIAAMTALGYDAAALGNHEFDLERDDLRAILGEADFPLLCANLRPLPGGGYEGLWQDGVVIPVRARDTAGRAVTVGVGVFGVLPPQVMQWDGRRVTGRLEAEDIASAAARAAQGLRAAGADLVVALAHSGISAAPHVAGAENAASAVARLDTVDAVVAGHVHKVFPGPWGPEAPGIDSDRGMLHGTPTVMPGTSGSHLGRLDLTLERKGARWAVAGFVSRAEPSRDVPEDPGLLGLLSGAHRHTLDMTQTVLGHLDAPVHSYFAMVRDDRSVRLVAEAKLAHLQRALSGTPLQGLPLLASVAPMKCGGRAGAEHYTDIPAGPVARRAIADMQFFSNELSVLRLTGAELLEWLEMSASLYNRLLPGRYDQRLFERDVAPYNRESVYGMTYEIDLSRPARYDPEGRLADPAAHRIIGAQLAGRALDPDGEVLLATNAYRAGGGGHFPHATAERAVTLEPVGIRDLLTRHLQTGRGRTDAAIRSWRFAELADTCAVFETGAGAVQAALPPDRRLHDLGPVSEGYRRYLLDLTPGLAQGRLAQRRMRGYMPS